MTKTHEEKRWEIFIYSSFSATTELLWIHFKIREVNKCDHCDASIGLHLFTSASKPSLRSHLCTIAFQAWARNSHFFSPYFKVDPHYLLVISFALGKHFDDLICIKKLGKMNTRWFCSINWMAIITSVCIMPATSACQLSCSTFHCLTESDLTWNAQITHCWRHPTTPECTLGP